RRSRRQRGPTGPSEAARTGRLQRSGDLPVPRQAQLIRRGRGVPPLGAPRLSFSGVPMKIWIWNAAALATVVALTLVLPKALARDERSRVAPYRYPLVTAVESDADLAFLRRRVDHVGEGLDLAALAGGCLKQARRSG